MYVCRCVCVYIVTSQHLGKIFFGKSLHCFDVLMELREQHINNDFFFFFLCLFVCLVCLFVLFD